MTTFVLDASILVDTFTERLAHEAIVEAIRGASAIAPAHMPAEAMSALGRLHRADLLSAERATWALDRLRTFPVDYVPVSRLLLDAWELRDNLRLADALYVALARQQQATLLTTDERLVASVPDVAQLASALPAVQEEE